MTPVFAAAGFAPRTGPRQPLLPGVAANGGLAYDEGALVPGPGSTWVSTCARGGHPRARRARQVRAPPHARGVVVPCGLAPERMRVTTTTLASGFFPLLASLGIGTSQVRVVPLDVAKARGQGSGWFSPYGDAALPGEPSLSLEYVLQDGTTVIELGEYVFKEKEGAPVFAYGVERVAMAASARLETWEHTPPAFKAAAEADAEALQTPLPVGYSWVIVS